MSHSLSEDHNGMLTSLRDVTAAQLKVFLTEGLESSAYSPRPFAISSSDFWGRWYRFATGSHQENNIARIRSTKVKYKNPTSFEEVSKCP